jgi:hypothetical protein
MSELSNVVLVSVEKLKDGRSYYWFTENAPPAFSCVGCDHDPLRILKVVGKAGLPVKWVGPAAGEFEALIAETRVASQNQ